MAIIVADRVLETSTTVGTGAYTLVGAVTGYRAASTVCINGDTFTYYADDVDAYGRSLGAWETGLGTWGTGGILTRTTVYSSSNANAAVSWAAGTRRIALALVSNASLGPTTAPTYTSTVTTGTAPLTVASTTKVANLNSDLLDDQEGSYYQNASNLNSGTVPDARISGSYSGLTNLTGSGSVDFAKFLGLAADTVTTPSFTWTGDTTTGIYRPAASQIAFSIAGVQRGWFDSAGLIVTGEVSAPYIGVENSVATNGYGISLYGGAQSGQPTYGLMFQGTATFGTYGPVNADWATYFTMNNTAGRGWIFKSNTGATGNVVAINTAGAAQFASSVTATNFVSNVATGTAPLTVASTTRVANLNAATAGNADTVTNGVYTTGNQTVGGIKTFSSVANFTAGGNQFLLKNSTNSDPTVIHRADGNNYYVLLSDAGTTPNGTWNILRPLTINQTSGIVNMGEGVTISGGLTSIAIGTPATPTGTPSTTGGTILATTTFAKIVGIDSMGNTTPASTQSAVVTTTTATSSIVWNWTALAGAKSYRIYVGATGINGNYFTSTTNTFTQTLPSSSGTAATPPTTNTTGSISAPFFNGGTYSTSDRRAKDNIRSLEYGLKDILKLMPKKFEMKKDGSTSIGLIAQEVNEIIPEVVAQISDEYLGINYSLLVSVLINAVKELKEEIEELKLNRRQL